MNEWGIRMIRIEMGMRRRKRTQSRGRARGKRDEKRRGEESKVRMNSSAISNSRYR